MNMYAVALFSDEERNRGEVLRHSTVLTIEAPHVIAENTRRAWDPDGTLGIEVAVFAIGEKLAQTSKVVRAMLGGD